MEKIKQQIIEKVNSERQTIKAYSDVKIPNDDWGQIIETIHWAPTSHGFEPYRVLVINKASPLRNELKSAMWNQGVITEADKLVLFISLKREVFASLPFLKARIARRMNQINNKNVDINDQEVKVAAEFVKNTHLDAQELSDDWAMKQAYIALGMAFYTAAILGIGSTPIEGFVREDIEKILLQKKLIFADERVAVAVAFGYPKDNTSYAHRGSGKRVRVPKAEKFIEV